MLQIYDKGDPFNPTDLRRRLKQVSRPVESEESRQEEQPAGDKQTETMEEKLTEKLDDIAGKIEKKAIETEAMWEQSQRELEEVKSPAHLLKMLFDAQMIR